LTLFRACRLFLLLGLPTVIIQSCSALNVFKKTEAPAATVCNQAQHVEVVSLAFYPDPLPDARRIDEWRLRVRSDTPDECQTLIQIVEVERELVAAQSSAYLILGVNEIKLIPDPEYRFTANERCFNVIAKSADGAIQIEGPKTFCALRIDNRWWTIR
jgi:hypothetical protein